MLHQDSEELPKQRRREVPPTIGVQLYSESPVTFWWRQLRFTPIAPPCVISGLTTSKRISGWKLPKRWAKIQSCEKIETLNKSIELFYKWSCLLISTDSNQFCKHIFNFPFWHLVLYLSVCILISVWVKTCLSLSLCSSQHKRWQQVMVHATSKLHARLALIWDNIWTRTFHEWSFTRLFLLQSFSYILPNLVIKQCSKLWCNHYGHVFRRIFFLKYNI